MYKILSLELGDEIIKIIEAVKSISGEVISIDNAISFRVPEGCINEGKIIDMETLKATVEKLLSENNINVKYAVFLISPNAVITRTLILPSLKRKSEIISMLNHELEQLQDSSVSYRIIYKLPDEAIHDTPFNQTPTKYIVYCISDNIYAQYRELARLLKLKLISLDLASNFLENISKVNIKIKDKSYEDGINAFVNIDCDRIMFCVLNKGINEFSREIYRNKIDNDGFCFDIFLDADVCLDQISKNIRYYYSIDKENIVENIYILTECSEIEGNDRYYTLNLNTNTEIITKVSEFNIDLIADNLNIINYFHTFFALLIDRNNISFLTEDIKSRRYKLFRGIITAVSMFFILLFICNFNINNSENLKLLEDKTEGMNIFLNSNENIALNNMAEDLKRDIASLEKYCSEAVNLKDLIMRENAVNSDFLSDIFKMKPDDISISFLNINSDNISIQCSSEKIEDIMLFIERLRQIEIIDSIDLPKIEGKQDEGYSVFILCKCKEVNNNVHH